MVLHEPDPAVIRAGAFAELCADLGAHLFDAQIAYLVAASRRRQPVYTSVCHPGSSPFCAETTEPALAGAGNQPGGAKEAWRPF